MYKLFTRSNGCVKLNLDLANCSYEEFEIEFKNNKLLRNAIMFCIQYNSGLDFGKLGEEYGYINNKRIYDLYVYAFEKTLI